MWAKQHREQKRFKSTQLNYITHLTQTDSKVGEGVELRKRFCSSKGSMLSTAQHTVNRGPVVVCNRVHTASYVVQKNVNCYRNKKKRGNLCSNDS